MKKVRVVIATAVLCAIRVQAQEISAGPLTSSPSVYGTTRYGGAYGYGVVYKVDQTGSETVLYSFAGGVDGKSPFGAVITDSAGNLYGTTIGGGKNNSGTVFKLDPAGNETVIHNFGGSGGVSPTAGLTRDAAGNLYGTTWLGGPFKQGVVYKLNANGDGTVLHTFTGGADGGRPSAGVIRDAAGNLYGTAPLGGSYGFGVVYKVDSAGNQTVLHAFTGAADGAYPEAPLTQDSAGNLYGTTNGGGTGGAGVVFRMDTSGNETVLYSFTGGSDGGAPLGGVESDSAGNLYGTTYYGGSGFGVVYKLDTNGNETVLHTFNRIDAYGIYPAAGVVLDSAGNLYGTTTTGVKKAGVVYKIGKGGQGTALYTFSGPDGSEPRSAVILR